MNKFLSIIVAISLFFTACKKPAAVSQQNTDQSTLSILDWKPLAFDYLVLKSKVTFKTKDNSVNATANIRIKKDSIIWISITPGLGIEVMRSIITPDSVKIINRLDNKYDKYSIDYLKETLGVDLNFYNLQNLIVGDLLLPLVHEDQIKDLLVEELWEVSQARKKVNALSLISKTQKKVTRLDARTQEQEQLLVNYGAFSMIDSLVMHQEQSLQLIQKQDTTFIDVSHQKIEFPTKAIAFPFSVPKKYEK